MEKKLPNHPNTATILSHYADLKRKLGQTKAAEELEARAEAIRGRRKGD